MEQYEVVILSDLTQTRWSLMFQADSFGHAEDQAVDMIERNGADDEIIEIKKDYNGQNSASS